MPRARREGARFDAFFRSLRGATLKAWTSREGFAYDRVIYSVGYPYRAGDLGRVLSYAGKARDEAALPPLKSLNRTLTDSVYPDLATQAPGGMSAEGWSAVLHFLDPSYPLATDAARQALVGLGFSLPETLTTRSYPAYVEAMDELKEKAPVWAVPETNWYLARVIEVGLEAFTQGPDLRAKARAAATS